MFLLGGRLGRRVVGGRVSHVMMLMMLFLPTRQGSVCYSFCGLEGPFSSIQLTASHAGGTRVNCFAQSVHVTGLGFLRTVPCLPTVYATGGW